MTKTKAKTTAKNTVNIIESVPHKLANEEFSKSVGKAESGANDYLERFLAVMDTVTKLKLGGFTLSDVCYFAQPLQLPPAETAALFEKWCDFMSRINKVTVIEGCYSEKLIVWCN